MESKRIIAIGDIHGCYHTMVDLLLKINYDSATDTLIFLGDYIDRGPFSYKVVKNPSKAPEPGRKRQSDLSSGKSRIAPYKLFSCCLDAQWRNVYTL